MVWVNTLPLTVEHPSAGLTMLPGRTLSKCKTIGTYYILVVCSDLST